MPLHNFPLVEVGGRINCEIYQRTLFHPRTAYQCDVCIASRPAVVISFNQTSIVMVSIHGPDPDLLPPELTSPTTAARRQPRVAQSPISIYAATLMRGFASPLSGFDLSLSTSSSVCSARCFSSAEVMQCVFAPVVKQRSAHGVLTGEIVNKEQMNAPSLLIVSIHSSYGSESNTIPPLANG